MLEHSLGCNPGYGPRHPHLAMLSDSTLNVGRCSPWMVPSSILLLPMPVLAACHLDNNLPPALLNPLDKQASCQSLRH
jgi:hypothetical protein